MINAAQFRADLPVFADPVAYPNGSIDYWINMASLLINTRRWGASAIETWPNSSPPKLTLYDFGVEMFVAHNLALERKATLGGAAGGVPGLSTGVAQSKSIDKVSVSYDTKSGIEPDAGHWALTIYGNRFLRMLRQAGSGPYQLGTSC